MRTEMAAEQREMLPGILDNIYYTWACGITEQSVRESIESAPLEMEEYKNAGFITGLKYYTEVKDDLILQLMRKDNLGIYYARRDLNSVSFKIYRKRNSQEIRGTASRADKTIATGGITSGESGYSPVMGGETVGAQVYTLRHSWIND